MSILGDIWTGFNQFARGDWDGDGQYYEWLPRNAQGNHYSIFDYDGDNMPFESALLDIGSYQSGHTADSSAASVDNNTTDNNSFMEYLEGLLASTGQENVENRLYNAAEAEKARLFSASEAQKNRDWQERMSGTAYQRAVADMQKAGLNPILAYQQGGATTSAGATAAPSSASYQTGGGDTLGGIINAFANLASSAADLLQFVVPKLSSSSSKSTISSVSNSTNVNHNFNYKK